MGSVLLRNSLSILSIVISTITILVAAVRVFYIYPVYLIHATYDFDVGLRCLLELIVLAVLMIILIKGTKYLIINIGCGPNDRPIKREELG